MSQIKVQSTSIKEIQEGLNTHIQEWIEAPKTSFEADTNWIEG